MAHIALIVALCTEQTGEMESTCLYHKITKLIYVKNDTNTSDVLLFVERSCRGIFSRVFFFSFALIRISFTSLSLSIRLGQQYYTKRKKKIKRIFKETASFGSRTVPTKMGKNLSLFLHLWGKKISDSHDSGCWSLLIKAWEKDH